MSEHPHQEFEGKTARQWAERLFFICRDLQNGDPYTLAVTERIAGELAPHFGTEDD